LPPYLPSFSVHAFPGLGEHVPEDAGDLVELRLPRDERRGDLNHGVATIVGTTDEPALEEARGEEAAEQRLALLLGEGLARLLVLDELERVEVPAPAQVAPDRQVEEPAERLAERVLVRSHVLGEPPPFHDLGVLGREAGHARMAAETAGVRNHGRSA